MSQRLEYEYASRWTEEELKEEVIVLASKILDLENYPEDSPRRLQIISAMGMVASEHYFKMGDGSDH